MGLTTSHDSLFGERHNLDPCSKKISLSGQSHHTADDGVQDLRDVREVEFHRCLD